MALLDIENQRLRQRVRELEAALRQMQATQTRLLEENTQLRTQVQEVGRHAVPRSNGRKYERVEATFRVDGLNSRGDTAMGVARNVSASGAFIETDLHFLPSENMTITFELLGRPFKLHAEVVRILEGGVAVRFATDPQQQATLLEVLARL